MCPKPNLSDLFLKAESMPACWGRIHERPQLSSQIQCPSSGNTEQTRKKDNGYVAMSVVVAPNHIGPARVLQFRAGQALSPGKILYYISIYITHFLYSNYVYRDRRGACSIVTRGSG